jgi:hypothetical protein
MPKRRSTDRRDVWGVPWYRLCWGARRRRQARVSRMGRRHHMRLLGDRALRLRLEVDLLLGLLRLIQGSSMDIGLHPRPQMLAR